MDALLERVLDAHGGLDAWASVSTLRAELSLDGPFWDWRGQPSIRRRQAITADPRRGHSTVSPLLGTDTTAVFMANWSYLTEPYLFTYPGVQAHEIEPWRENGQTWRRLAVEFPADIPNHNPRQTFYYGADYLLRRMDYTPEITGNSLVAHYTHDPRSFDGFVFYTRREVHLRDADGNADLSLTPITITLHSATVEKSRS